MSDVGCQMSVREEVRCRMSEVGGGREEVRSRRSEGGRQKVEKK